MTDDTGMLQHAIFSVPNTREGYTTDDNARALIVSNLLNEATLYGSGVDYAKLSNRYLAFLWLAFHSDIGRFRNFLGYDRRWLEDVGSEDSHGRALWALGTVLGHSQDAGLRGAAGRLFEAAMPAALTFTSPRAWAFSILGMQAYLDWFPGRQSHARCAQHACQSAAEDLRAVAVRRHGIGLRRVWPTRMPRLSQALILAGWRSDNHKMIAMGIESLEWLVAAQHRGDEEDLCAHRLEWILRRRQGESAF